MIRITKPATAPGALQTRGAAATKRICAAFDADPDGCRNGSVSFKFDSAIYGAVDVRQALLAAQHGKCCFCESRIDHVTYGDVEHFRPKAGFDQGPGKPLERPGYYWLAYQWSNLYVCCQLCNQMYKKNHFPLRNPSKRARCHHDDVAHEKPAFLDPGKEEPAEHIGFRAEYAFPVDGSPRGRVTIETLGLNRAALLESRRDLLAQIGLLIEHRDLLRKKATAGRLSKDLRGMLEEIERRLEACKAAEAQYAAMARCALEK